MYNSEFVQLKLCPFTAQKKLNLQTNTFEFGGYQNQWELGAQTGWLGWLEWPCAAPEHWGSDVCTADSSGWISHTHTDCSAAATNPRPNRTTASGLRLLSTTMSRQRCSSANHHQHNSSMTSRIHQNLPEPVMGTSPPGRSSPVWLKDYSQGLTQRNITRVACPGPPHQVKRSSWTPSCSGLEVWLLTVL